MDRKQRVRHEGETGQYELGRIAEEPNGSVVDDQGIGVLRRHETVFPRATSIDGLFVRSVDARVALAIAWCSVYFQCLVDSDATQGVARIALITTTSCS